MKYARVLALLAVAAAAMMAFAASASATTLTSEGALYTGTIHASNENGHVILENPAAKIECVSTFTGNVTGHGVSSTATGSISTLDFTGCTNGWTVTVNTPGNLEIHTDVEDPEGLTGNGTLTSSGATVTAVNDSVGITCRYKTENTDIGTLTGSHTTGATATLDIHAEIPFHSGSIFCGSGKSTWQGQYLVETPMNLDVDHPTG